LKAAIKAGEFTFHKVNGVVRVLEDINSMVTTSDTCGDVFKAPSQTKGKFCLMHCLEQHQDT